MQCADTFGVRFQVCKVCWGWGWGLCKNNMQKIITCKTVRTVKIPSVGRPSPGRKLAGPGQLTTSRCGAGWLRGGRQPGAREAVPGRSLGGAGEPIPPTFGAGPQPQPLPGRGHRCLTSQRGSPDSPLGQSGAGSRSPRSPHLGSPLTAFLLPRLACNFPFFPGFWRRRRLADPPGHSLSRRRAGIEPARNTHGSCPSAARRARCPWDTA